eukprot:118448-Rhodomonas_salina.1
MCVCESNTGCRALALADAAPDAARLPVGRSRGKGKSEGALEHADLRDDGCVFRPDHAALRNSSLLTVAIEGASETDTRKGRGL